MNQFDLIVSPVSTVSFHQKHNTNTKTDDAPEVELNINQCETHLNCSDKQTAIIEGNTLLTEVC